MTEEERLEKLQQYEKEFQELHQIMVIEFAKYHNSANFFFRKQSRAQRQVFRKIVKKIEATAKRMNKIAQQMAILRIGYKRQQGHYKSEKYKIQWIPKKKSTT